MSLSYQVKPKPKPNSKLWLVRFDPRPVKTSTCVCKKTKHTSDISTKHEKTETKTRRVLRFDAMKSAQHIQESLVLKHRYTRSGH